MKLKVYNIEGKETGKEIELAADVFNTEVNEHAIYLSVKQFLANQRQGTHKAKQRNEIHGSTRKIKKQKGTGTARFGNIKNPLFRHGGRMHGPQPRDYSFKLNKKVKNLANRSALTQKAQENRLMLVEDFTFDVPKTKSFIQLLKNFELDGQKSVMVIGSNDSAVYKSARNIPKTEVVAAEDLNVYDILNCQKLLMTVEAIKTVQERLK